MIIDTLHPEEMGDQGNENLSGLADIEISSQNKIDKNLEEDSH